MPLFVGFQNLGDRRGRAVSGDNRSVKVVDVEGVDDTLVDRTPTSVVGSGVDAGDGVGVVEVVAEAFCAEAEFGVGAGALVLAACFVEPDAVAAFDDLGAGECPVGGEVDESFFALFELG